MSDFIDFKRNSLSQPSIETFLGKLFQFRDLTHLAHLGTSSYAQHMALNDLYEGLLDHIDTLVETAQRDSLLKISIPASDSMQSSDVAKELLNYVKQNRSIFPQTFQQNILDEIEELTSKTIYKLTHLK